MDCIVEVVGVFKCIVYNYFLSKEVLFLMILEELWECSVVSDVLLYCVDQLLQMQLLQLLGQKLDLFSDGNFIDLVWVVMVEIIYLLECVQVIVCCMGEKESGESVWICVVIVDGCLCEVDLDFVGYQLYGLVKSFVFWLQVMMG